MYADGSRVWIVNKQRHRLDGPAIIDADGRREWHVNGERTTEEALMQKYRELGKVPWMIFDVSHFDQAPLTSQLRKRLGRIEVEWVEVYGAGR